MSDNELDNLFKEAAEGFKAPSGPSAWKDMSNRLDQAAVGTSSFWNWGAISGIAVVSVTGVALVWYLTTNDIEQEKSNEIISSQEVEGKDSNQASVAEPPEASSVSTEQKTQNDLTEGDEYQLQQSTRETLTDSKHPTDQTAVSSKQEKGLRKTQQSTSSPETNDHVGATNNTATAKAEENGTSQGSTNDVTKNRNNESMPAAPSLVGITPDNQVNQLAPDNEAQNTVGVGSRMDNDSLKKSMEDKAVLLDSTSSSKTKEQREEKSKRVGPVINVKLVVGSDYSSINYFTPDKAGLNYGLLLGYSFNNRWSIYSGVLSSRKIYTSNDIDKAYTIYGGYDYPVNQLDGDCRVLDIPINVYYTFFPARSFSLKAGIGFSSYLMLSEAYTYYVDKPYGSAIYYQNFNNENNEWFKVMNVSVILQKKLNDRFHLEFEPFLKAPLAGVGEGEVSLVSAGAFLNLRFDIPINKP